MSFKTRLIFIFIIVFSTEYSLAQNIENGFYVGTKRVLFGKTHSILFVSDSVAFLENYMIWQGQMLAINRRDPKGYQPEKLTLVNEVYKNQFSEVRLKNENLLSIQIKTFAGKFKTTNYKKIDFLPESILQIRKEAYLFEGLEDLENIESVEYKNWVNQSILSTN